MIALYHLVLIMTFSLSDELVLLVMQFFMIVNKGGEEEFELAEGERLFGANVFISMRKKKIIILNSNFF